MKTVSNTGEIIRFDLAKSNTDYASHTDPPTHLVINANPKINI